MAYLGPIMDPERDPRMDPRMDPYPGHLLTPQSRAVVVGLSAKKDARGRDEMDPEWTQNGPQNGPKRDPKRGI